MVFRYRLKSALAKVVPHLLILLCSLGAAVIYCHHWPLPQSASSPAPNWVFTSQLHLGPAVFAYLSILILLRIMAGVTEWVSARRPWWDRLRERREPALAQVVPHLLILLCSFGAMLIYWHHWDVPQAESNFVAAFIQLHAPGFYGVLPYWYYFGPGLVIYLVYLLLRRAMLAVIEFVPDWRPWWDRLRERLEPPLAIVFATVVPHLLILLCSFGASLIYWHHWDVPQPGSNFVALAFIHLHAPDFCSALLRLLVLFRADRCRLPRSITSPESTQMETDLAALVASAAETLAPFKPGYHFHLARRGTLLRLLGRMASLLLPTFPPPWKQPGPGPGPVS